MTCTSAVVFLPSFPLSHALLSLSLLFSLPPLDPFSRSLVQRLTHKNNGRALHRASSSRLPLPLLLPTPTTTTVPGTFTCSLTCKQTHTNAHTHTREGMSEAGYESSSGGEADDEMTVSAASSAPTGTSVKQAASVVTSVGKGQQRWPTLSTQKQQQNWPSSMPPRFYYATGATGAGTTTGLVHTHRMSGRNIDARVGSILAIVIFTILSCILVLVGLLFKRSGGEACRTFTHTQTHTHAVALFGWLRFSGFCMMSRTQTSVQPGKRG